MHTQGYRVAEEAALLDQAVEGDRLAFDELARRYRPHMVARAQVIVGPSDAEDVVQTALVSAYRALEGGTKPDSFVAWLSTITRNAAISHQRALHAEPLGAAVFGQAADDAAIERDEVRRMTVAINDLPATERSALIMRELEGRGHLEIAASEGITVGAARMAIHRARVRVRAAVAAALIPLPFLLRPFRWIASNGPSVGVTGAAAAATAAGVATIAIATGGGGGGAEPSGSGGPPGSGASGTAIAAAPADGGESKDGEDRDGGKPNRDSGRAKDDRSSSSKPTATTASTQPVTAAAPPAPAPQQTPAAEPPVGTAPEAQGDPEPAPPAPPPPPDSGEPPQEPPVTEPPAPPGPPAPPPAPPPPPPAPTACNGLVPCVLDLVDGVLGGGR